MNTYRSNAGVAGVLYFIGTAAGILSLVSRNLSARPGRSAALLPMPTR